MRIRQVLALAATAVILFGFPYTATALLDWPDLSGLSWSTLRVYLQGGLVPPGYEDAYGMRDGQDKVIGTIDRSPTGAG